MRYSRMKVKFGTYQGNGDSTAATPTTPKKATPRKTTNKPTDKAQVSKKRKVDQEDVDDEEAGAGKKSEKKPKVKHEPDVVDEEEEDDAFA